jgi:capsular polysaccharide transport system permease protein
MQQISFLKSLQLQQRVLSALIRREIIALTGKKGLGFLMLMLEPFVFVVVLGLVFILRADHFKNVPVIEFCLSGYCILWACRFHIMKMMNVIAVNQALLYHRYVKMIDIMIARAIIQCFTTTISLLLLFPLVFFGAIDYPNDPPLIIFSWILVQWYGFSFSIIAGAAVGLYKFGLKICLILGAFHVLITGGFFMVDWLPSTYADYALIFPMVHATEMMRDGLFGNMVPTHYSGLYIICGNLVITYIGLALCRQLALRGPIDDSY